MQLLAAVDDFVLQLAINRGMVDDVLLASVGQSHEGSRPEPQVVPSWRAIQGMIRAPLLWHKARLQ